MKLQPQDASNLQKLHLSDAEMQRITAIRARAHAIAPDFVDVVKAFHGAGLIDGWRNVRFVGTEEEWEAYAATRGETTSCRLSGNLAKDATCDF